MAQDSGAMEDPTPVGESPRAFLDVSIPLQIRVSNLEISFRH